MIVLFLVMKFTGLLLDVTAIHVYVGLGNIGHFMLCTC